MVIYRHARMQGPEDLNFQEENTLVHPEEE
jgi:hypothetical protein